MFVLCSLLNDWNYFWNKYCNLPFLAIEVRSYLPLLSLVKVLDFSIICFEVIPLIGCFRQLLLILYERDFYSWEFYFFGSKYIERFLYLAGATGRRIAFHLAKIHIFSTSLANLASYYYWNFSEGVKVTHTKKALHR